MYLFLQSHTYMMHSSASIMCYVLRCLEMLGFPHNHFVKIGGVQEDSKFQVAKLVLPLNKHKAGLSMGWLSYTGFRTPPLSILSISC